MARQGLRATTWLASLFLLRRGQVSENGRHLGLADMKRLFAEHLRDAALGWWKIASG
jgi:hypothetical protein